MVQRVHSIHTSARRNVSNIPCEDPKKLIGRVVETTLYDITSDFRINQTKLHFLITSTAGNRAETILKSHEYSLDYLRSLVRRGSTRIDGNIHGSDARQILGACLRESRSVMAACRVLRSMRSGV